MTNTELIQEHLKIEWLEPPGALRYEPQLLYQCKADYELRNTREKFRRETENLPVCNWGIMTFFS